MKRACIICGARVRNPNLKTNTCDAICTFAKEKKIDRNLSAFQLAMLEQEEKEFLDSIAPAARLQILGEIQP